MSVFHNPQFNLQNFDQDICFTYKATISWLTPQIWYHQIIFLQNRQLLYISLFSCRRTIYQQLQPEQLVRNVNMVNMTIFAIIRRTNTRFGMLINNQSNTQLISKLCEGNDSNFAHTKNINVQYHIEQLKLHEPGATKILKYYIFYTNLCCS